MLKAALLAFVAHLATLPVVAPAHAEPDARRAFALAARSSGREVHIAPGPQGRDDGDGSAEHPFATIERARDEVRAMQQRGGLPGGGVTVTLHAGRYELARPLALTAEDAGTEGAPIVYRAAPGGEVRISGGKRISGWKAVTDPAVLERLDPAARGKVVQADLRAQGIT
ncbi:MAG: hypothetical protein IT433_11130, partial [Phycisphaerales bacterium]|nr:hypothetical protein [Phycisphaerales bacterium]